MVRLNKYLAECGICSRREADKLIDTGKVTVNGKVANMGIRVTEKDQVQVHGKTIKSQNETVILAYNKPIGVTCTEKDKYAKKTVIEDVKFPVRVTYAGRLDKDSEGLLLLTNDGDLIHRLMGAANYHEKEYIVKVDKEITEDFLRDMGNGVYLKELKQTTRTCTVNKIGKYTFSIVLTQGLNRQIRRMCQAFGYEVKSLKRIRIAQIMLGKLKTGEYRPLSEMEKKELYNSIK